MKIVILIAVIESFAVMLAIMYFYYRRGRSGKRVSGIVGGAALLSKFETETNGAHCRSEQQTVKSKL
jgi:RsiW-degrading membrane proteinase PrsW (M82 family)